ncbi:MAG: complex I subunit 5 family protein [bacterium]
MAIPLEQAGSQLQIFVPICLIFAAVIMPLIARLARRLREPLYLLATTLAAIMSTIIFIKILTSPIGYLEYFVGYGWRGARILNTGQPIGIVLRTDLFGAILLILINGIGLLASIYSIPYIEHGVPKSRHTYYYTLFLLMLGGMSGIAITGDIFNFYVFFEIASISSYALVSITGKAESLEATFKYLLVGALSSIFIVFAIGLLFNATGTLNMQYAAKQVAKIVTSEPESYIYPLRYLIFASLGLFIMGFSVKAALFPGHAWLADAHPVAPSAISALLSGLVIKATGIFPLVRFLFGIFAIHSGYYGRLLRPLFLTIAVITMVGGSFFAIAQTKLKRMLAFSTIAQVGYIMFGIGLITHFGLAGSILHIINHAIVKGLLFLVSGIIIYKTGITEIADMGKLGYKMPLTMTCFAIGACSMVGVPPLSGFMSKWVLANAAYQAGLPFLIFFLLLSSLLNAVYYFRVVAISYFGIPKIDIQKRDDPPALMQIPVVILTFLVVLMGILIKFPFDKAAMPAALLVLK